MSESNKSAEFLTGSFENLRKRLLDLSTRNSLINYRFPTASCLRFVDELPNQLAAHLLNGGVFRLIAVPEPTEQQLIETGYLQVDDETEEIIVVGHPEAREWAKHLGFAVDYELPMTEADDDRHTDSELQTLMYANDLERRLRSIRSKANSAIEETGSNILYLSLGFLEWYESNESDIARRTPLYTMPIELERGRLDPTVGVYRYEIKLKEDGLLTNIALREKLANDFGLGLPDVSEEQSPEDYFRSIENLVKVPQPKWRVQRQAALTLLNFTKQVMYHDLDLSRWPDPRQVTKHNVLSRFLAASHDAPDDTNSGFTEEYDIDVLPDVHTQYPIVFDADSSQHSALVDAIKGKNLVIEGPPGTGKSQTIANLVAAAIGNGKRVLFVAEKMAALEVVKSRLDAAGLGDFCLELHSHRTNRLQILHDLTRQLDNRGQKKQENISNKIERFERLRNQLSTHSDEVNSTWKETSLSVYQILTAAVHYTCLTEKDPHQFRIEGLTGNNCSSTSKEDLKDNMDMLESVYQQAADQAPLGRIENHPWYGVTSSQLASDRVANATTSLTHWNERIENLEQIAAEFLKKLETSLPPSSLDELRKLAKAISALPESEANEFLAVLPKLITEHEAVDRALTQREKIEQHHQRMNAVITAPALENVNTPKVLIATAQALQSTGAPPTLTLSDAAIEARSIEVLIKDSEALATEIGEIREHLPEVLAKEFADDVSGVRNFLNASRLVENLSARLWRQRDDTYDEPELDEYLAEIKPLLDTRSNLESKLGSTFVLERLPSSDELESNASTLVATAGLFGWLSGPRRKSIKFVLSLVTNGTKKDTALAALGEASKYAKNREALQHLDSRYPECARLFSNNQLEYEEHRQLRAWYSDIRRAFGLGFSKTAGLGNALIGLERNIGTGWASAGEQGLTAKCQELLQQVDTLNSRYPGAAVNAPATMAISHSDSALAQLQRKLANSSALQGDTLINSDLPLSKFQSLAEAITRLQDERHKWQTQQVVSAVLPGIGDLPYLSGDASAITLQRARSAAEIAKQMSASDILSVLVSKATNPAEVYNHARLLKPKFTTAVQAEVDSSLSFAEQASANLTEWSKAGRSSAQAMLKRNINAIENPNWLSTWMQYLRVAQKLGGAGYQPIVNALENCELQKSELKDVALMAFYHQLATEVLEEHPRLKEFNGLEQSAIRDKFREHDKELLVLQRDSIAARGQTSSVPAGNSRGRVSEFTQEALIRHEANKKRRHIPVRSLMLRAGDAIQALKPCFMMSPMSVAQYLKPGAFEFDMVVMDEASQIRPEDAIGAIVRGKSLVVVGDPKQLPPTSFFQKAIDEHNVEDYTAMEDAGSILESAIPIFTTRRLRWHYRSRHESLIAFSNQSFYDSNLVLFPSPKADDPEFGVHFHPVEGRFGGGRNTEEARQAVDMAAQIILEGKESVALVAMNIRQCDELELQFEQSLKDDHLLRSAHEKHLDSEEPLLIKNLENIQGDERDVVVISMTYGPEEIGSRVMQRFGPINSDMGWRRLNVLFTRSKKRMHIFSSMSSTDILGGDSAKRGVQSLKAFLEYCETGRLRSATHTGRPPDSDFEVAVIKMLEAKGYSCEPQLGIAGYFLDIAVKDPTNPGAFLLGIECDGATYHSAKSARDRDRLRQQVLEGLGWKIRRIWSADWFRNPEAQLMPILNELEKLKGSHLAQKKQAETAEEPRDTTKVEQVGPRKRTIDPRKVNHKKTGGGDLRAKLLHLEQQVIRPALPDTAKNSRLLRSSMLEALLYLKPRSKAEFAEVIPAYLRNGTDGAEGIYLEEVLDLIDLYG